MAGLGLNVSPAALLLAAALYFIGGLPALTAFFSAVLAHELGHLTALYMTKAAVRGVRVTVAGPVIEYAGALTARQEAGIVAAGPLAGILFACLCFLADTSYFGYVGMISLLASMFNLLPVPHMDGGRLAGYLLETVMPPSSAAVFVRITGTLCALGVFLTGTQLRSPAAAAAGLWMAALANMPDLL